METHVESGNETVERLAVVILNWNGAGFLQRFLPGVVADSTGGNAPRQCEVTVVVADNGSTDNSLAWIKEAFPDGAGGALKVIPFDQNYGFTGGYNRALRDETLAGYDFFLLLNSDVEVTPGWLGPLVEALRGNPDVGAAMPKIHAFGRNNTFEYAGACGGFIDLLGYPFCRGRIFGTLEKDEGQYDFPRDIFWASGAALLVRASLWRRLGGLDESFFAHMEEIDFCWRLHRAGYRVLVVPQSVVAHVGGGALPATSPRKTYLNFRNNIAMLYKNLSRGWFALVYGVRLWTDGALVLAYLVTGKTAFSGAVLKAHRDFWRRMWPRLVRESADGNFALPPKQILYRGSVALRYLLGRRTFGNMM